MRVWIFAFCGLLAALPARADYYAKPAQWMTSQGPGFTLSYPIDFDADETPQASTDWRWDQTSPGQILLRITVPRAVESQTNFGGATLTVGRGKAADCAASAKGAARIGTVTFRVLTTSDAGMSHYHDIVSYRVARGGWCWVVETQVASTALGVYDPARGLKPFNAARINALMVRMAQTFRFR